MGTSKDFPGSTGGGWTGFKRAATRLARDGPGDPRAVAAVVARNAEAFGGATAAAASAIAGRRAAQQVGRLLGGIASGGGLTPTLEELGLGEFIGRSPLELISALSDAIGGDGATLEENAAREALVFVLLELFGDAQTYEDLEALALDADAVRDNFAKFIARYVYLRLLPMLDQRLVQRGDQEAAAQTERAVWEYTLEQTRLHLAETDVVGLDWHSPEADALAGDILRGVYGVFGE
jgi:hypothetical protein